MKGHCPVLVLGSLCSCGPQTWGCFRPYYYSPLFCMPQVHSHVFSWLPGSAAHAKGPGASFFPKESPGQSSSWCCTQGTAWGQRRAGILSIKIDPIPYFFKMSVACPLKSVWMLMTAGVKSCCHSYSCVMLKFRNSPEYLVSWMFCGGNRFCGK